MPVRARCAGQFRAGVRGARAARSGRVVLTPVGNAPFRCPPGGVCRGGPSAPVARSHSPGSGVVVLAVVRDAFVVADDLGDDEGEELLGEGRVQLGVLGEAAEPGDLVGLAGGVGGRQLVGRLEVADLLGALEAFGEHVDDGGVDVVDAVAQPGEFRTDGGVGFLGLAGGHVSQPYGAGGGSIMGGSSGSGTRLLQPPGTVRPCCSRKRTGGMPTRRVKRREK